jgi:hypothetical protein
MGVGAFGDINMEELSANDEAVAEESDAGTKSTQGPAIRIFARVHEVARTGLRLEKTL